MANTKAIGVAYEDQKIVGGTVDNTPVGATAASSGAFTTLSASGATTLDGDVAIGNAAADLVAFHGATPVDQYAFVADQSINALISGSVVGFTTSASFSSTIEKVNTILALLIEKGLMAAS
jgi:hypothetical protein